MCSIVIPTFNRKKFEALISHNITCQDYPNIIEVIVADDGDDSQQLDLKIPYPIQYIRCPRMTIGKKRNLLVSNAKGEYIAHFDTDDIYFPTYISESIKILETQNKDATGTSDMTFMYKDGHCGAMRNPFLSMANEATMVYKRKFWEQGPFSENQTNEGIAFYKGRHWQIGHSNIMVTMVCLCHENNTVDKNPWRKPESFRIPDITAYKPFLIELGFSL